MPINPVEFYADPIINNRIKQYMGVADHNKSSPYFSAKGPSVSGLRWDLNHKTSRKGQDWSTFKIENLDKLMEKGEELFRGAYSPNGTWILIDVEEHCGTNPGRIYDPKLVKHIFTEEIEPVYDLTRRNLDRFGIDYMSIMTGQGYHFSLFVPKGTDARASLESIGFVPLTLATKYTTTYSGSRKNVMRVEDGLAFSGARRLVSNIAYNVIKQSAGLQIPTMLFDLVPGNGQQIGIGLDLSWYSDPVHMRVGRSIFSVHRKGPGTRIALPRHYKGVDGEWHDESLETLLDSRMHYERAIEIAKKVDARIPDGSKGVQLAIEDYLQSPLREFHRKFDELPEDPTHLWKRGYDAWPQNGDVIPRCVRHIVDNPYPEMLRLPQLRTLISTMLSKGWEPTHIAGFIRSKYEKPQFGWSDDPGCNWDKFDPDERARAWVELFTGAIITGADELIDVNCISRQENKYCSWPGCGTNLADFKPRAVA